MLWSIWMMSRRNKPRKNKGTFFPPDPRERILREFGGSADLPGLNALVIGSSVFETEQALRRDRVRRVVLPIYRVSGIDYDLTALKELIHELLIFTLVEDIEVDFRSVERKQAGSEVARRAHSVPNLCLFSGGTDSYAGILLAKDHLRRVEGVFCAHADQARIIHIVANLQRKILEPRRISVTKVPIPSIGARGYAQLRGFLYLLAAAAVAQKLGSQRIVVTECGPTMYQPRFSPLDSITMTTHPVVVRAAARVASLLLNREIQVITPFENLTKAEVIAICPAKEGLKKTHSCISQRFGSHDGTCYGCVIRRLATIAAGVDDVKYDKNPISDPGANAGNLYSLLAFCYEVLTDFSEMEEFEAGSIEVYGKRDLFRRFALDNFAAIRRLLMENKRVVRPIRALYEDLAQQLGDRIFDERLVELASPNVVPSFPRDSDKFSRKPPIRPTHRNSQIVSI
jgi:7-cyano-7-deazaguanine synthase in queuosine biosynthesis